MPLVSVCIPTYNYARFIGRAIESVLAQTHSDLELIVLDDASTDQTAAVIARYHGDERLSVQCYERNIGLFANFNRCLDAGRGEYVKVLCADDWLHPRSIEDALAAFSRSPSAGMAASSGWLVDARDRVIGLLRAPFGDEPLVPRAQAIGAHADWGNAAGMPTHVLLRREAIAAVGGFEPEFAPASDVHLWLKVLSRYDLAWVPEPRCYLRIHDEHGHQWAYEPSESVFLLWEQMAHREPAVVDGAMLRRALQREARHHLLYVGAHLLHLRPRSATRLLRAVGRHVPLRSALPRFALALPRIVWEQGLRLLALGTGRMVMYDPTPRPGPRRHEFPVSRG